jgi:hypothetical protein
MSEHAIRTTAATTSEAADRGACVVGVDGAASWAAQHDQQPSAAAAAWRIGDRRDQRGVVMLVRSAFDEVTVASGGDFLGGVAPHRCLGALIRRHRLAAVVRRGQNAARS